ncbi:MAG: Gfo/Idh/MocA family oxidoreductase [Acidobacteriota bacterium]|nr:Gfo/Idh/MocA family oxidoreductase [Acidobacteriota bacterium]
MNRRHFITSTAGAWAAAHLTGNTANLYSANRKYRAAVIGHTGVGGYGHGWDEAFNPFDAIDVVAVADPDATGRKEVMAHTGAKQGYRDYQEMLRKENPDLVSICPHALDHRLEMVTAAAESGAHILMEKPFARDLVEADAMVKAIRKSGVKVQVGFVTATLPMTRRVLQMVRQGEIGVLQEIRARGKEDRRAGGEDLMVLGCHLMHLLRMFAGNPKWVFAHVTDHEFEMERSHAREKQGPGSMGALAGDQVATIFYLGQGVHAYFGSKANDVKTGRRFGIYLYGSKGVIYLPTVSGAAILRSPDWHSGAWEPIELTAEERAGSDQLATLMVADLLQAIEEDREPAVTEYDGRWTTEMISSVYQSQLTGARVTFPLKDRTHPLERGV